MFQHMLLAYKHPLTGAQPPIVPSMFPVPSVQVMSMTGQEYFTHRSEDGVPSGGDTGAVPYNEQVRCLSLATLSNC